jgi:ABC-type spermidine/putrescine transport system permease subunit I
MASVATVTIGYCFALLVWLKPARWRLLFIGLALCPLLISEIAIIFGWWMFFPRNGLLSYALLSTGLITDKISLMYTEFAAFVGLVYVTLPYCFFILLSILDGIDKRVLEASADLGAPPVRTFGEVLLPLTWTGILVAFSQCFIWTMGTYATPSALGPDTLWTMGFLIQEQMLGKHNWPMASALAVILVAGVAAVMVLTRSLQSKRTSFHA